MAKPYFPDALKGATWSPHNFGNLACNYLDMGGDSRDLKEGLNIILDTKKECPHNEFFYWEGSESEIGKHICDKGFIRLLNHPDFQGIKKEHHEFRKYAGTTFREYGNKETTLLVKSSPDNSMVFWRPQMEYSRMLPTSSIELFLNENNTPIIKSLFNELVEAPRKDISAPARQTIKSIHLALHKT
jgi:hypothetical protein